MRFYRRLLGFLRPHRWRMAAAIVSNLVAAALDGYSFVLLIPFLNSLFGLDALPLKNDWLNQMLRSTVGVLMVPNDPMASLRHVVLVILGVVLVKNVFVWNAGTMAVELQEFVTRDLRDAVYRHLQRLPIGYFTSTKTGQILSRVLADTEQTRQLVTAVVTQALQAAALVVVYIVAMIGISPKLTLIALVVAPVTTAMLQPLLKRLRRGYRRLRNDHGEMMSVLQESVSGIRLVKSFGAEGHEESRFIGASHTYSRGLVRMARIALISQPLTETLGTLVTVVLLLVGAQIVLVQKTLTPPEFIAFLALVTRLLRPSKQLSQIPTTAQNAFAAAERLFDVLDTPTETVIDRGTRDVEGFRDAIAFEHVSFAYDAEPVLSDITFTARPGDVVALVGPSGAGKSTLVDLIPRFYEPTAGRILLDGVDTREIRLASLRSLIGIVSQETVIFNDTVLNNIAYGSTPGQYTQEQVEAAARAANAHGFITELPQGYQTLLGERGARLSGGQRQRIAIARALLVDPPILILDEATSALDTESERLVQEAIDRLLAGRTVFVIAHRLSTIQHAHQILVLERGRIVERGTHAELLSGRGMYSRLHALQFRDREPPVMAV
ncbi:MAG TPA: ABC transporter transmembrane domain-containing protein [Gemmatimonadaceae bacterium]|nr:ABC transporter transmembrane domain-containing protein [Gemmatimonadaceae bacterium]